MPDVVLHASGLSKTFGPTTVLTDASLAVGRGEVHALLGGNGSGKSTLVKLLAGVHRADPGGTISVGGASTPAERWSAEVARQHGLHFVHQDPAVFPALSVAENIAIGHGFVTGRTGRIDRRATRRRTAEVLERFSIPATPDMPVAALRPADRVMVAIARALQDQEDAHDGVLVLDEPTASLPAWEVEVLLTALRRYAEAGQTIVYVSHRLGEVLGLADTVTVLRDGHVVGSRAVSGMTESGLVEMIVGRPLDRVFPEPRTAPPGEVALSVRGLVAGPLRGVDLELHRGEVLGVAGLLGSGRTELLHALFGDLPTTSGELLLDGRPLRVRGPREAMRAGLALVPEDRGAEGLFAGMSVRANLSATVVPSYWRRGRLRHRAERDDARRLVHRYGVKPASDLPPAGTLSGGNQQKVVLGRWLRREPAVLLLDEPTQGVDVNARADIYTHVRAAADRGTAVLLVTSDFEEMAHVADRVVVLREGRVAAELRAPDITADRLTELSYLTAEVPA
ncbi:sugar ABC transporter ATP-binding protein [Geodermatophilus sp. DF01-2]|uniref:sugar ABC transporter ATP-binding protein n=1 Tax=Geodermatophilus sp. DF01-2 TaxID=2559610 RepID=UPI0010748B1B|nr:sugar ABC transporter ATP-binding protein [Geodermatophilus sp. DF01_2]TFV62198.1 sugar ABC transporter ATP-binding protein [Geodermatophilus sp. DF01_2]